MRLFRILGLWVAGVLLWSGLAIANNFDVTVLDGFWVYQGASFAEKADTDVSELKKAPLFEIRDGLAYFNNGCAAECEIVVKPWETVYAETFKGGTPPLYQTDNADVTLELPSEIMALEQALGVPVEPLMVFVLMNGCDVPFANILVHNDTIYVYEYGAYAARYRRVGLAEYAETAGWRAGQTNEYTFAYGNGTLQIFQDLHDDKDVPEAYGLMYAKYPVAAKYLRPEPPIGEAFSKYRENGLILNYKYYPEKDLRFTLMHDDGAIAAIIMRESGLTLTKIMYVAE